MNFVYMNDTVMWYEDITQAPEKAYFSRDGRLNSTASEKPPEPPKDPIAIRLLRYSGLLIEVSLRFLLVAWLV